MGACLRLNLRTSLTPKFRTVGSYEKPTFSEDEKEKFSKFNQLDEDLYKMSNSTFWEKAGKRKGGTQKLSQDVQNLKVKSDIFFLNLIKPKF